MNPTLPPLSNGSSIWDISTTRIMRGLKRMDCCGAAMEAGGLPTLYVMPELPLKRLRRFNLTGIKRARLRCNSRVRNGLARFPRNRLIKEHEMFTYIGLPVLGTDIRRRLR